MAVVIRVVGPITVIVSIGGVYIVNEQSEAALVPFTALSVGGVHQVNLIATNKHRVFCCVC